MMMSMVMKIIILQLAIGISVGFSIIAENERTTRNIPTERELFYVVSLRVRGIHICSGTVIDGNYILTAAHCVQNQNQISVNFISRSVEGSYEVSDRFIEPEGIFPHEGFQNDVNDIAIIKLKQPFTLSRFERNISLPYDTTLVDSHVTAISQGIPVINDHSFFLKKVGMKVIANSVCQFMNSAHVIHNEHICTKTISGDSSCTGDSGGPVIKDNEIVGVISAYKTPCGGFRPRIFTRVSKYIHWIETTMKSSSS